jgi:hypothetical protein
MMTSISHDNYEDRHQVGVDVLSTKLTITASVVWWSQFLARDLEVPGSIPGTTRFSEK